MANSRYIPKIDSIVRAAETLPEAATWRTDTYHVPLNEERLLEFKRVKFRNKQGEPVYKWIYEGKVQVT